ncbi:MAG: helix-turn-helix domain-containing protein [Azonexus sp.]|nr:helix-turn-helix domain-containing protein [Azonexus sp.]
MTESQSPGFAPEQAAEASREGVSGVGARLRVAREMRQLSVDEVAQALKLGPRQVEALESGNWQGLPGQTFVRGFVRNYARLLQIDPAPLMDHLDATLEKPVDSLHVPAGRPATMPSGQPRRDRTVVIAGLVLVVLAALAYALLPNDLSALRERAQGLIDSVSRKEPAPAPATGSAPTATPAAPESVFPPGTTPQQVMNPQAQAPAEMAPAPLAAPAVAPSAMPAVAADNAQLRFVFARESWVEVRDRDNKVVYSQRSPAGAEQSVGGQGPLSLVIGNATGVKLFWRGQAVDLAPHTKGEVARLVLE